MTPRKWKVGDEALVRHGHGIYRCHIVAIEETAVPGLSQATVEIPMEGRAEPLTVKRSLRFLEPVPVPKKLPA